MKWLVALILLVGCQQAPERYIKILGVAEGLGTKCQYSVVGEVEPVEGEACQQPFHVIVSVDFETKKVRCGVVKVDCEVVETD